MKMKKYTQQDFILFEVDEFGRKICPSGGLYGHKRVW